jgi:hypothetical protein
LRVPIAMRWILRTKPVDTPELSVFLLTCPALHDRLLV